MTAGKMPPCDLDAEDATLATCMIRGAEAVDEVAEILDFTHFYSGKNREIFAACFDLAAASDTVDIVTVASRLRDRKQIDRVGGLAYLTELISSAPAITVTALRAYATTVRAKATLRSVLEACQKAVAQIYEGVAEVDPFLQSFEAEIHDATMSRRTTNVRKMHEVVASCVRSVIAREKTGIVSGIPTKLRDLDFVMGGFHPNDLTVIAARPGMGKTSLALQFAVEVARQGKGAIFFSLEMPEEQIGNRVLSMESRVPVQCVRTGKFSPGDWSRFLSTAGDVGPLPIFVVDQADTPLAAMRTIVRRAQTELANKDVSLGLVIIDYLQLMTGRPGKHSRDEVVSEITRGLKSMAKESNVAVIALSQLNRDVEKRADKHPLLSDLRESGAIEQDADNVLFIYRDDYYDAKTKEPGIADIHVAKQRNGPTSMVKVKFLPEWTKFMDAPDSRTDS
jgi:replicative DNA helicase